MNIERIDTLIEEIANHISKSLNSGNLIPIVEMTKALAELISVRASLDK